MVMPNFNSVEEAKDWMTKKIKILSEAYEKANNIQEKRKAFESFSLNDFNPEEVQNPLVLGVSPLKDFPQYIEIKDLLRDFFSWVLVEKSINASFEIYLDQFFMQSHSQKMILVAENIKRIPFSRETEQVRIVLETYKTMYELSLHHLKTILEIILKKKNIQLTKDLGLRELESNFNDYPKIKEILSFFDNYSRNPVGHESWTYNEGKLLFKSKGTISEVKLEDIVAEIAKHIMFHTAYQAIAIEGYQKIIREGKLTEEQMDTIYSNFKNKSLNV